MTIKRLTKADIPQSLGAFKPVGHVLIAFTDWPHGQEAAEALRGRGFQDEELLEFECAELCGRMNEEDLV